MSRGHHVTNFTTIILPYCAERYSYIHTVTDRLLLYRYRPIRVPLKKNAVKEQICWLRSGQVSSTTDVRPSGCGPPSMLWVWLSWFFLRWWKSKYSSNAEKNRQQLATGKRHWGSTTLSSHRSPWNPSAHLQTRGHSAICYTSLARNSQYEQMQTSN